MFQSCRNLPSFRQISAPTQYASVYELLDFLIKNKIVNSFQCPHRGGNHAHFQTVMVSKIIHVIYFAMLKIKDL